MAVDSLEGRGLLVRVDELRDSQSGLPVCEVSISHRKRTKVGAVCVAIATTVVLDRAVSGAVLMVSFWRCW